MFRLNNRAKCRLREITTVQEYAEVLSHDFAIVFKHSTVCDLSQAAHEEVLDYCSEHQNAHVFLVSVLDSPEVTRHIAEKTSIRHESPQVIALRKGEVVGTASHRKVTAALLKKLTV